VNDLFRREIDAEAQDSRRPSGPHGGTARPARSVRILDEVGPLELRMGNGFLDALEALRRTPAVPALIVVRPSLVDEVRRLFPDRPVRIRWASRRTREAGAKALYEWVLAETPPD
jgi:nucleoside-triphosphatase THEP1